MTSIKIYGQLSNKKLQKLKANPEVTITIKGVGEYKALMVSYDISREIWPIRFLGDRKPYFRKGPPTTTLELTDLEPKDD